MVRRSWMWLAACVVAAGCGNGISEPASACIAVVNVFGATFTTAGNVAVPAGTVSDQPYLTISRNTGCQDLNPSPNAALAHGESNFLESGTALHTVEGFAPEERLAVYSAVLGEWQALVPHG